MISNKADFAYAFQDIVIEEFGAKRFHNFVRILKCRGGYDSSGNIYQLKYDSDTQLYYDDLLKKFSEFKEFWKDRQKL